MTVHDVKVLNEILSHCDMVAGIVTQAETYSGFVSKSGVSSSAVDNVKRIMELTHDKLSSEFKSSCSRIHGNGIYSMQDYLESWFCGLDLPLLWAFIVKDIPELAHAFRGELAECNIESTAVC